MHMMSKPIVQRLTAAFACVSCAATLGCHGPRAQHEVDVLGGRMHASYNPQTGRLTELTYDVDNDGKRETRAYLDGTRLVKVEADENGDDRIDRWEYYTPGRPDAMLERVESSTRRDGIVSRRQYYESGVLARAEEDTDGDGVVDKWDTYVHGVLSTMAFDFDHRGVPNRRLVYGAGGVPQRLEIDSKREGRFVPVQHADLGR
jgi:hypothetical protein